MFRMVTAAVLILIANAIAVQRIFDSLQVYKAAAFDSAVHFKKKPLSSNPKYAAVFDSESNQLKTYPMDSISGSGESAEVVENQYLPFSEEGMYRKSVARQTSSGIIISPDTVPVSIFSASVSFGPMCTDTSGNVFANTHVGWGTQRLYKQTAGTGTFSVVVSVDKSIAAICCKKSTNEILGLENVNSRNNCRIYKVVDTSWVQIDSITVSISSNGGRGTSILVNDSGDIYAVVYRIPVRKLHGSSTWEKMYPQGYAMNTVVAKGDSVFGFCNAASTLKGIYVIGGSSTWSQYDTAGRSYAHGWADKWGNIYITEIYGSVYARFHGETVFKKIIASNSYTLGGTYCALNDSMYISQGNGFSPGNIYQLENFDGVNTQKLKVEGVSVFDGVIAMKKKIAWNPRTGVAVMTNDTLTSCALDTLKTAIGLSVDSMQIYDGAADTLFVWRSGKRWEFLPLSNK